MVQMPPGIPVGTVSIDGADNAAILAAQILGVSDQVISEKLITMKKDMENKVIEKDNQLQEKLK